MQVLRAARERLANHERSIRVRPSFVTKGGGDSVRFVDITQQQAGRDDAVLGSRHLSHNEPMHLSVRNLLARTMTHRSPARAAHCQIAYVVSVEPVGPSHASYAQQTAEECSRPTLSSSGSRVPAQPFSRIQSSPDWFC